MNITKKSIKSLCSSTIYKRGEEYYRQGRVHIKSRDDENLTAAVDGEEMYNVRIKMSDDKFTGMYCSCPYFETMNTPCKHIIATLLRRESELCGNETFSDDNEKLTTALCKSFGNLTAEKKRLRIKFEPSVLVKGFADIEYGVKIFIEEKLLSSPEGFLECLKSGETFKVSRYIEYSNDTCTFTDAENQILSILLESFESRITLGNLLYNRSYGEVPVGGEAMKRIFNILPSCDYSFVYNRMNTGKTNIHFENPDILIDVSAADGEIILYSGSYGTALTSDGALFYIDDGIYVTSAHWQSWFMPIYKSLSRDMRTQLSFKGENAMSFAAYVLPVISKQRGVATDGIENTVINEKPVFTVYLDRDGRGILCTVKVSYGGISLLLPEAAHRSKKIVVRNLKLENEVLSLLSDFEYKNGYYRLNDDEKIFSFLSEGIYTLSGLAEIIMSESFKTLKITDSIGLEGFARYDEKSGLLESTLKTDLSYEEIRDILSAVKLKKRFYRLKDGSFADLEKEQARLMRLSRLGFNAGDLTLDKKILPRYQLLYLNAIAESGESFGVSVSSEITDYVEKIRSEKAEIPENLKGVLRDYQKEGVNWLSRLSNLGLGGILADDMGLGKTVQVLAFLYGKKPEKPVLIVAPSSLTYNWKNEMTKFIPDTSVMIIDGNGKEREELISQISSFDFLITSYPLLRRDIDKYEDFEFSYCIIDEAQNIKNPRTANAHSVKKIKAEHKFALTGTPIENSLSELWSVFDFLMPGYLYKHSDFKEWFEYPIIRDMDENALSELKTKISPFILRRMKKDVLSELPEKFENTIYADMTEEQEKLYAAYQAASKDKALALLAESGGRIEILTMLTRLRQICCHPSLFDENYTGDSGKLRVLTETVTTAVSSGHRVLVFSQFTSMLEIIKEELKKENTDCFYLDGSTPPQRRTELAERFNGGERAVFLISLKAGGFGLNLTGADTVIHFDPWWNPAVTEQASDRAYRIGQTANVQVIKLVTKNTIEEKILKLAESKKKLASDFLDGANTGLSAMSAEEILTLFD